jgi:hypothetical protein
LFGVDALGFGSDEQLNKAILRSIKTAQTQRSSFTEKEHAFRKQLPSLVERFRAALPEFRRDFTIYLLPSLDRLDGAGRKVDGVPALLFGVDLIVSIHDSSEIPVFVDHELFHRYHFQASQMSDDDTEHDVFWKALWVEGLATYASKMLNPKVPLGAALMDPTLAPAARRVFPTLIYECEAELDEKNHQAFSRFFLYHGAGAYPPSRSGYYIGFLAAQVLGQNLSLSELAHLNVSEAHDRLRKVLPLLSAESKNADR